MIGGALMYLAGNIVAPNDVFVGNREILGTLTCYYPYFAVIAAGILYLVIRALEAWDESAEESKRSGRRDGDRKERKRRLRFPGHYSGLFYRILWKDLKYLMEGYGVSLPVCVFVCPVSLPGAWDSSRTFPEATERTAVCWA